MLQHLSSTTKSIVYIAALAVLASCGGQDVKPAMPTEAVAPPVVKAETPPVVVPVKPVEPPPEPVVEVTPTAAAPAAPVKVEALPAEAPAPVPAPPVSVTPAVPMAPPAAAAVPVTPAAAAAPPAPVPDMAHDAHAAVDVPPAESLPKSTGPQHFVVSIVKKDASHPQFGKGHPIGFAVNGVPGKELVVERGKVYTFEVVTDPKHDVYISSKEIGWGGGAITEGVEGAYIYKGTIKFTPDANTPDLVYYACRNHPYMGWQIHVVNPGQKAPAPGTVTAPVEEEAVSSAPPPVVVDADAQAKQKLMFAEMMLTSQGAKRVAASPSEEAKALLAKAQALVPAAREKLVAGKGAESLRMLDDALRYIGEASRKVPSEDVLAKLRERNAELLQSVAGFEASHAKNYERVLKKQGAKAAVDYDKAKVAALKEQSKGEAGKGNYDRANALLEEAEHLITGAIHKMLDSQTLVYDLNFATPADEYDYELKRFESYDELIPIAIAEKKPAEGAIKLINDFAAQGRAKRADAEKKAAEGDHATAVVMLKFATVDIQRALRIAGVSQ